MGNVLQRVIYGVSKLMEVVAGIFLIFMMLLTTCDVIMRVFGKPILGTYEMVAFSGGIVIGFSIPITSWLRGQVFVDFFYKRFSQPTRNLFHYATRIACIMLFFFSGWNLCKFATAVYRSGEASLDLQLPIYPIGYGIAFACFVQCLVLIVDILKIGRGEYE